MSVFNCMDRTGSGDIPLSRVYANFDVDCECCKEDITIEKGYILDLYQEGSKYQYIEGNNNFNKDDSNWALLSYLEHEKEIEKFDCCSYLDCSAKKMRIFLKQFKTSGDFNAHKKGLLKVAKKVQRDGTRSFSSKMKSILKKTQIKEKIVKRHRFFVHYGYCT